MKNLIIKRLFFLFLFCISLNIFAQKEPLIIMRKTSCYGKCPVYKMEIYKNGEIFLKGEKNIDKIGNYYLKISKKEIKKLIKNFKEIDFYNLQDEYTAKITDLPTTYISFNYKNNKKNIKDYYGAPKDLKKLEEKIANLLQLDKWEKKN